MIANTNTFYKCLHKVATFLLLNVRGSTLLYKVVSFLLIFSDVCALIAEAWYVAKAPDGYVEAVRSIGPVALHSMGLAKVFHYLVYYDTYVDIVADINRKCFTFRHFNFHALTDKVTQKSGRKELMSYSQLKLYWAGLSTNSREENEEDYTEYLRNETEINSRFSLYSFGLLAFLLSGAFGSLMFTYFRAIFLPATVYYDTKARKTVVLDSLPYNMIHVLNIDDPVQFKISAYFQLITFGHMSFSFLTIDFFFHSFLMVLTGQLETIRRMLGEIKFGSDFQNQSRDRKVNAQLVMCIEHLADICNIQAKIEKNFTSLMLYHYTLATMVMVSVSYVLPLVEDALFLYGYIVFAVLSITHPFLSCWISSQLESKFAELPTAFYDMDWENASPGVRRSLVFSMYRFQKPITVTIGKLSNLNLQFFLLFVQRIYTVYTLYNKQNQREQRN